MEFITLHQRFGGGKPIYVRPSHISAIWESEEFCKDTIILVDGIRLEVEESCEKVRALATAKCIAEKVWS